MIVRDDQVGPAPQSLKWRSGKWRRRLYSSVHEGKTLTAVWVNRKQWVVSINGRYLDHVFESAAAAKRYLSGGSLAEAE